MKLKSSVISKTEREENTLYNQDVSVHILLEHNSKKLWFSGKHEVFFTFCCLSGQSLEAMFWSIAFGPSTCLHRQSANQITSSRCKLFRRRNFLVVHVYWFIFVGMVSTSCSIFFTFWSFSYFQSRNQVANIQAHGIFDLLFLELRNRKWSSIQPPSSKSLATTLQTNTDTATLLLFPLFQQMPWYSEILVKFSCYYVIFISDFLPQTVRWEKIKSRGTIIIFLVLCYVTFQLTFLVIPSVQSVSYLVVWCMAISLLKIFVCL